MAKKILIVDDEPGITLMLSARLKAGGYEVAVAADGQEGLDSARELKPDLVILDLMLPKIDGYKVCGFLKNDTRYAAIPILMFSARARDEDKKTAFEVGANAYVTKPFKPQEILEKIRELTGE